MKFKISPVLYKEMKLKQFCAHCKKKLNLTNQFGCVCDQIFCSLHRYVESHDCPKRNVKIQQEKDHLKSSLLKVEPSKIEVL
jgi:hypothetical protein